MIAALDAERKRQERVVTELREQMDHLLQEAKRAQGSSHRAETGVGGSWGSRLVLRLVATVANHDVQFEV